MGNYLSEPNKTKHSDTGEGNGHCWGSSEMQGWRIGMEDAHVTLSSMDGALGSTSMFAVFDGHGGKEVAKFCARHMPAELVSAYTRYKDFGKALVHAFERMDDLLRIDAHRAELAEWKSQGKGGNEGAEVASSSSGSAPSNPQTAALQSSIRQDMMEASAKGSMSKQNMQQMLLKMLVMKKIGERGGDVEAEEGGLPTANGVGCTAVCVLLTQTEIICANAGDSRAVLCRKGKAVPLSRDHKPNEDSERQRIENAGGTVEAIKREKSTMYRVNGNLSLARAIGDLQYKARADLPPAAQIICATPEVVYDSVSSDDEFLVIACDGIWDVKTSQEVCNFVRRRLMKQQPTDKVAEQLMDSCISEDPKKSQGIGGDNMTVVIVKFDRWDCREAGSACACTIS